MLKILSNIAFVVMCFLTGKGAGELTWKFVKHSKLAKAHPNIGAMMMILGLAVTVAIVILSRKGLES